MCTHRRWWVEHVDSCFFLFLIVNLLMALVLICSSSIIYCIISNGKTLRRLSSTMRNDSFNRVLLFLKVNLTVKIDCWTSYCRSKILQNLLPSTPHLQLNKYGSLIINVASYIYYIESLSTLHKLRFSDP